MTSLFGLNFLEEIPVAPEVGAYDAEQELWVGDDSLPTFALNSTGLPGSSKKDSGWMSGPGHPDFDF